MSATLFSPLSATVTNESFFQGNHQLIEAHKQIDTMPYDLENRRPPVPTQIPKVVNVKDPVKAMIKALTEGNIWAMSMLLVRGCSVDMLLDEEGTTPLIYLCSRTKALRPEDNDAIRFLISEG